MHVQGAELEYTLQSWVAPATRMVSHMGPEDTNPLVAGTSRGCGTIGGAAMGVGVGQMKLDAPPQYADGRHPGVRVWLSQME